MKRYLRYASFIVFIGLMLSCSSHKDTGEAEIPPIITVDRVTQKYNLQLDFRKNHFSGMLIARQMDNDEIRLLFTTHFGLSVFDLSLRKDSMIVNSCVGAMRKKKILHLLEKDFRLIFLPTRHTRIKEKSTTFEKRMNGKGITKAIITLTEFSDSKPGQVHIKHPLIKLNIQLNELEMSN
ncbi:hypothetical protein LJC72_09550 [Bacteroides sp. OttesenSCG-928-D19]|nr:hypothetical protein [Bacteroides sp. OttesenSCG-928-N06]MDL2305564.1 hypothetical protein [Bacteroides sp. OttesenSCG-928-D19]